MRHAILCLLPFLFISCFERDDNGPLWPVERYDPSLVGSWVSADTNIAPFVQETYDNRIAFIYLTFGDNMTYYERKFFKDSSMISSQGAYSVIRGVFGWSISLYQTIPDTARHSGLYAISGAEMKWEVVRTRPSSGHRPPYPYQGFGSTDLGDRNIQKYV